MESDIVRTIYVGSYSMFSNINLIQSLFLVADSYLAG